MFDIRTVSKRYFSIKIGEISLDIEPPKVKALKKITALSKAKDEDAMEDLAEAVAMILNKNKSGYKVSQEIIDELDFDQLQEILAAYFQWLSKEKSSKN